MSRNDVQMNKLDSILKEAWSTTMQYEHFLQFL